MALSRSAMQQQNRQRVIDVARDHFLRDGYAATSLATIADAAGFSTGVVYSNFAGKPDLALQVLRAIESEQLAALQEAVDGDSALEEKVDAVRGWAEQALRSGWPRLELDFALAHRDDRALVRTESERHASIVRLIADEMTTLLPASVQTEELRHALAESVLNVAIGTAVRSIIDPAAPVLDFMDVLKEIGPTAT